MSMRRVVRQLAHLTGSEGVHGGSTVGGVGHLGGGLTLRMEHVLR